MFSYKFVVNTERKNAVRLRVFNLGKKSEISLGISMTPEELAEIIAGRKASTSVHTSLIRQWMGQLEILKAELLRVGKAGIDVKNLRDEVQKTLFGIEPDKDKPEVDSKNWEKFYVRYLGSKRNQSYHDSCDYTLKKMRSLCDDFSKLTFEDITLKWLKDFDEKLIESGASQNTRNIHFKNIRTCLNRAIDEELTQNYPFRRFKIRPEKTRKRNLPVEELRRLFDYPVEEYQKYYLDYFKLIFMLVGINTIDLFNLTKIESGRIEYRRAKTHRLYSIKVEPEAMEIINRHKGEKALLDIADRWGSHREFQKYCNIALKKIGKMERKGRGGKKEIKPEWPELSTYWARHSWATIARSIGVSIDDIALSLGHGDGHDLTRIYLDEDLQKVDEANRRVLDWVLYGKSKKKGPRSRAAQSHL